MSENEPNELININSPDQQEPEKEKSVEEIALSRLKDLSTFDKAIPVRFMFSGLLKYNLENGFNGSSFVIDNLHKGLNVDAGLTKNHNFSVMVNKEIYDELQRCGIPSPLISEYVNDLKTYYPDIYENLMSQIPNISEMITQIKDLYSKFRIANPLETTKRNKNGKWFQLDMDSREYGQDFIFFLGKLLKESPNGVTSGQLDDLINSADLQDSSKYIHEIVDEYIESNGEKEVFVFHHGHKDEWRRDIFKLEGIIKDKIADLGLYNQSNIEMLINTYSQNSTNIELVKNVVLNLLRKEKIEDWSFEEQDLFYTTIVNSVSANAVAEQLYDIAVIIDPDQIKSKTQGGLSSEYHLTAENNAIIGIIPVYLNMPFNYLVNKLKQYFTENPDMSRPIYDSRGNMMWPEKMSSDEIKKIKQEEREKKTLEGQNTI